MQAFLDPMTRHAQQRAKDRSIPDIARWLLLEFGARRNTGGGAVAYSFDKKGWRALQRFLGAWPLKKMEQLRRVYMVVSSDGAVITLAYHD